jgi:hypothetical protein
MGVQTKTWRPVNERTWLVVRDEWRDVLEARALEPMANLRSELEAARQARIADGWDADQIGRRTAFFFAQKKGKRVRTTIEHWDPALPPSLGHSSKHSLLGIALAGVARAGAVIVRQGLVGMRLAQPSLAAAGGDPDPC